MSPSSQDDLATFRYHTLFISDLHLGSQKTATPYLYEFLKHVDYSELKTLYLVGDIVGGWEHQGENQRPLPEMEKRCLDIINYAAANGVKVIFMPGNHDEKLRPKLDALNKRRKFELFHQNVIFANEAYYETEGPQKLRFKVVHGDQHDPDLFVKPWFRPITFMTSALYDGLVKANYHLSDWMYQNFGVHVSVAKQLKNSFKKTINFFFAHDSLLKGLDDTGFDGVIMGHTHMAGIQTFERDGRKSYLINDGDWVESCCAAYVDDPTQMPKILDYKRERHKYGFGALPKEQDKHPEHFAAFRPQTDRQVRFIHRLWPARDRKEVMAEYWREQRKLEERGGELQQLRTMMDRLSLDARLDPSSRKRLADLMNDTGSDLYTTQKKGLSEVFKRTAEGDKLRGNDLTFTRTIIREFSSRAQSKVRQQEQVVERTLKKLDF